MDKTSLGWEDPLDEGMAIYSSILAWRTPWTEEPGAGRGGGLATVHRVAKSQTLFHFSFHGQIIDPSTKIWRKGSQKIR